jgi:hypothetical protein
MFNTPYWSAVIADDVRRSKFAENFVKLHDDDSERMFNCVRRIISHYNACKRQETEAHLQAINATPHDPALIDAYDRAVAKRINVGELLDVIADRLRPSRNGYAFYALRVLHQKELGSVKSLDKLRALMRGIHEYSDDEEIREWLEDHLNIFKCNDCHEWEYESKQCQTYHDDYVCRSCANYNYRYSEYYGSYVYSDDSRSAIGRNGESLIIHCDDDDFHYDDDDDEYHHYDYSPEPQIIGNYHSSKRYHRPIVDDWSRKTNRFFGVELEVELRGDRVDRTGKARQLNDLINDGEIGNRVFFENDGSLNSGFEIVSQPMSLPMHRDVWQWLNDKDAVASLRSHNTSTCGLHVHVSRAGLTKLQIAKMVTFVNDPNNEQLIRAIARRYAEGYCKIKEKKIGSAHYSSDRYEAINVTGEKTIEFRIFKGSLKYESVVAALEFCHSLVEFTRPASEGDIKNLTMDHYMEFISDHMHKDTTVLRPYIENRLELA